MTKEEARSLVGGTVLYSSGFREPEKVVITEATPITVEISWPDSEQRRRVLPGCLMPLPGEGADPLAAIQGRLNDFVAAVIRAARGDSEQAQAALSALRELNWAAGLDFEGVPPAPPGASREYHAGMAGCHAGSLEIARAWEKSRAAIQASSLRHSVPPDVAALVRQLEADAPALVYLVIHTALGAAKIGVTDAAGSRIAQHRRAGWQLLAAFQVSAKMACAIEDDVLRCWRHELGLPSYLRRDQMPQGGWTETVAAGRVDLAATVAHVCELALSARSAAHSLESPALLGHCHPLNQFLRSAGPGPAQNASCSIASRMDRTLAIMRRTVSGSACAAVIGTPPPRFLRLLGW